MVYVRNRHAPNESVNVNGEITIISFRRQKRKNEAKKFVKLYATGNRT